MMATFYKCKQGTVIMKETFYKCKVGKSYKNRDGWVGELNLMRRLNLSGRVCLYKLSGLTCVNGEFIDLIDFVNSSISVSETDEFKTFIDECGNVNFKYQRNKKAITSAFRWLEAWGSYQLIVCRMYSYNVLHHMISYQIFILSLFAKYKLPYVITYDIRHRQILGRRRSFEFSRLNQELFVTTFDANAIRSVNRCTKCSAVDHATGDCPFRGTGQTANLPRAKNSDQSSEICLLFQQGLCKPSRKCRRKHVCMGCGGKEGFRDCAKCSKSKN